MDDNLRLHISELIEFIKYTTERESVTNEIVGEILDFLNALLKDVAAISSTTKSDFERFSKDVTEYLDTVRESLPDLQNTVSMLDAWRKKYAGVPALLEAIERWRQGLHGVMALTHPIQVISGTSQVLLSGHGVSLLDGAEFGCDVFLPGATETMAGVMTAQHVANLLDISQEVNRLKQGTSALGKVNVNLWLGDRYGDSVFSLESAVDALMADGGFTQLIGTAVPAGLEITFLSSRSDMRPGGEWVTYRYVGPGPADWVQIVGSQQIEIDVAVDPIPDAEIDALFEDFHKVHE